MFVASLVGNLNQELVVAKRGEELAKAWLMARAGKGRRRRPGQRGKVAKVSPVSAPIVEIV